MRVQGERHVEMVVVVVVLGHMSAEDYICEVFKTKRNVA